MKHFIDRCMNSFITLMMIGALMTLAFIGLITRLRIILKYPKQIGRWTHG